MSAGLLSFSGKTMKCGWNLSENINKNTKIKLLICSWVNKRNQDNANQNLRIFQSKFWHGKTESFECFYVSLWHADVHAYAVSSTGYKWLPCSGSNLINSVVEWTCDLMRCCVKSPGPPSCSKSGSVRVCACNSFNKGTCQQCNTLTQKTTNNIKLCW